MNSASTRQYNAAYKQLENGQSATYNQVTGGSYVNSEWVSGVTVSEPITCYQDTPSTSDIDKGLASITDTKILVSAKALGSVIPSIGGTVVFSDVTMTVKQIDQVKSLEGVTVLYMLFSSRMA